MSKSTSKLFGEENAKLSEAANEAVESKMEEALNPPVAPEEQEEQKELPAEAPVDDIQDVDISVVRKQRFRFNHDNSMILELNTSDMGVFARLKSAYERLNKLMEEVGTVISDMPEDDDVTGMDKVVETLDKLDKGMKKEVDYIFDAPVSSVLCRDGSMYDPIDGMFRYEHIIDKISNLYENNLSREFGKMRQRVNSRTDKYTKKFHK